MKTDPRRREPRRPRSPERQGPPRGLPEYDYFHNVDYHDYLDYFDYDDYFDYFDNVDYFLSESEDPLIRCVTPTLTPYYICVSYRIFSNSRVRGYGRLGEMRWLKRS